MNSGSSALIVLGRAMGGDVARRIVQPDVALGVPGDFAAGVLDDDDRLDAIDLLSAMSTLAFSGTLRPPRRPSSAVITTSDLASSMRPASASGEKPPNTIEWIAPMRAQASIA